MRHIEPISVNDANPTRPPAYAVASLRAATRGAIGGDRRSAFVRVDNLFDRRYAGSVIVNEGNARYFEPAPTRAWLAGLALSL